LLSHVRGRRHRHFFYTVLTTFRNNKHIDQLQKKTDTNFEFRVATLQSHQKRALTVEGKRGNARRRVRKDRFPRPNFIRKYLRFVAIFVIKIRRRVALWLIIFSACVKSCFSSLLNKLLLMKTPSLELIRVTSKYSVACSACYLVII
jgi:hypothetical protein